jgi:hypothetical protein
LSVRRSLRYSVLNFCAVETGFVSIGETNQVNVDIYKFSTMKSFSTSWISLFELRWFCKIRHLKSPKCQKLTRFVIQRINFRAVLQLHSLSKDGYEWLTWKLVGRRVSNFKSLSLYLKGKPRQTSVNRIMNLASMNLWL